MLLLLPSIAEAVFEFNTTVCTSGCDYTLFSTAEATLNADIRDSVNLNRCGNWDTQVAADIPDATSVTWNSGVDSGTLMHMTGDEYYIKCDTTGECNNLADNDTVTDGTNSFDVNGTPDHCTIRIDCAESVQFTDNFSIDGGRGDADNNLTIGVLEAYRHDGTPGTGCRITSGAWSVMSINDPYGTIEWFNVENSLSFNTSSGANCLTANANWPNINMTYSNIVVLDCANDHGAGVASGIFISPYQGGGANYINNCIVINPEEHGIRASAVVGNQNTYMWNNTVIDAGQYGFHCNSTVGTCESENNIAIGSGTGDYSSNFDVLTTSASGDTTGTSGYRNYVAADEWVDPTGTPVDVHLKSGATSIDNGADKGTTRGVNFDIDGRDRDAEGDTWDLGADEFVAAVSASRRHALFY